MATTVSARRPQIEGSINVHALGAAFAVLLGCSHLGWSILVLLGWAQPILDFIFWLHFLEPPYRVGPFGPGRALALIAVTSGIGYALGAFAGIVWNRLDPARP
jgi:hypothetical protein